MSTFLEKYVYIQKYNIIHVRSQFSTEELT